ncbi:hypothetical protein NQZ68_008469 [Dissostichus eleginoides]|nr:hypothetical protein NQZ68_008469 [Dissostichus eleginoides]
MPKKYFLLQILQLGKTGEDTWSLHDVQPHAATPSAVDKRICFHALPQARARVTQRSLLKAGLARAELLTARSHTEAALRAEHSGSERLSQPGEEKNTHPGFHLIFSEISQRNNPILGFLFLHNFLLSVIFSE